MPRIEQDHQARRPRPSPELSYRLLLWRAHRRRLLIELIEEEARLWHERAEYQRARLRHPSQGRRSA